MGGALRIALVQTRPRLGERSANLAAIAAAARSANAELYVLPELATSGYALADRKQALALAERPEGSEGLRRLQELCEERNAAMAVGLPLAEGDGLFNAAALLRPGLPAVFYRKLHLFDREPEIFDPGPDPPAVFEWRGVRLGLMICFDWLFPETTRLLALAGADLIVHPSNLVLSHCQEAMRVRAIENGVFTVTVNRVGEERYPDGERLGFTGCSQATDPDGKRTLALPADEEAVGVISIEPARSRDKRITARNHLLGDRRPSLYVGLIEETDDGA